MPNHVTNWVYVNGPIESISDFRQGCFTEKDGERIFDFNKIFPTPAFITTSDIVFGSREDKTGRNWYNWNNLHWGTKWNSYSNHTQSDTPEKLQFSFQTAWAHPSPIMNSLGAWFPELKISVDYHDEYDGTITSLVKDHGSSEFVELLLYKPQLCCDADLEKLQYPIYGLPKIDGVRLLNFNGIATGRSLQPHANEFVKEFFSCKVYRGFDGEATVGSITSPSLCRDTTSALNTVEGEPHVVWYVFDYITNWTVGLSYEHRYKMLKDEVAKNKPDNVKVVPVTVLKNIAQVMSFYRKCLDEGYEGIILRDPQGLHKEGRCTQNEGAYLRVKPSSDKDAEVVAVVEAMKNNNPPKTNALGLQERSSHKENKVGKGMIGSLVCRDLDSGNMYNIAPGKMTHQERIHYFNHPEEIIGQYIKYRSMDAGVKDAPRFGRFISFRSKEDTLISQQPDERDKTIEEIKTETPELLETL